MNELSLTAFGLKVLTLMILLFGNSKQNFYMSTLRWLNIFSLLKDIQEKAHDETSKQIFFKKKKKDKCCRRTL